MAKQANILTVRPNPLNEETHFDVAGQNLFPRFLETKTRWISFRIRDPMGRRRTTRGTYLTSGLIISSSVTGIYYMA
jgi:hypothetical protein